MQLGDFALFQARWSRFTPAPVRWLGVIFNFASTFAGMILTGGAFSFGAAAGWWLFEWVSQ